MYLFFYLQIEEDAYQEDLGFSLGTIGKSKTGRIRGPVVDSKTKARISKSLQVELTLLLGLSLTRHSEICIRNRMSKHAYLGGFQ